jgi:hypothetical protein
MFRLVTTVRRGSASDLAAAWAPYPRIEAARLGAAALLREDRVLRVMIVKDELLRTFFEWVERTCDLLVRRAKKGGNLGQRETVAPRFSACSCN